MTGYGAPTAPWSRSIVVVAVTMARKALTKAVRHHPSRFGNLAAIITGNRLVTLGQLAAAIKAALANSSQVSK
jgi:hypothetical protein